MTRSLLFNKSRSAKKANKLGWMELERNKSGGIAFVNEQQMGVGDIIPNGHSCSLLSILCK
jgi:hypothetical protein